MNLIQNAREAIVASNQSSKTIKVNMSGNENGFTLEIHDNGSGIPENVQDSIFDKNITTKENGSGIGLYMSKMIIEDHFNGTISFTSNQEGTCFTVHIPVLENQN